jgi:hypothetical protein
MTTLFSSWITIRHLGFFVHYLTHLILALDIYLIVKDPFKPQKSRNLSYLKSIFIATLIKVISLVIWPYDTFEQTLMTLGLTVVIYLLMWYYLLQALCVMRDQGTSAELRCSLTGKYLWCMLYYTLQLVQTIVRSEYLLSHGRQSESTFLKELSAESELGLLVSFAVGISTLLLLATRASEPFI